VSKLTFYVAKELVGEYVKHECRSTLDCYSHYLASILGGGEEGGRGKSGSHHSCVNFLFVACSILRFSVVVYPLIRNSGLRTMNPSVANSNLMWVELVAPYS
jgi:hypothetical protein